MFTIETRKKLIQAEMVKVQKEVNHERVDYERMKISNSKSNEKIPDLVCLYDSFWRTKPNKNELHEHEDNIPNQMDELKILNMNTLQIKLDIMDIINNKKKHHYQLFLDKFVHSVSRIFFDSTVILATKINNNNNTIQTS